MIKDRKKILFILTCGQMVLGLGLMFNPSFSGTTLDFALRIMGLFLIILSSLWIVTYRLVRFGKIRELEKKDELEQKKKDEEVIWVAPFTNVMSVEKSMKILFRYKLIGD